MLQQITNRQWSGYSAVGIVDTFLIASTTDHREMLPRFTTTTAISANQETLIADEAWRHLSLAWQWKNLILCLCADTPASTKWDERTNERETAALYLSLSHTGPFYHSAAGFGG